jgi:hypothetical protein
MALAIILRIMVDCRFQQEYGMQVENPVGEDIESNRKQVATERKGRPSGGTSSEWNQQRFLFI